MLDKGFEGKNRRVKFLFRLRMAVSTPILSIKIKELWNYSKYV